MLYRLRKQRTPSGRSVHTCRRVFDASWLVYDQELDRSEMKGVVAMMMTMSDWKLASCAWLVQG